MRSTILAWETAVARGEGILTKKVGVPAAKDLLGFGSRPGLLPGAPDCIHPLYRESILCFSDPPGFPATWHVRKEYKARQGERDCNYAVDDEKPLP